ncbi:MAG: riboflavin biosynthesis protein RibD [bacterium TMED198]|nr:MAG: riboflavin biosynthesis protein RibD [bacterium TMED198]
MLENYNIKPHISFMERALSLAKKGRGSVSPNPLVGCVVVKDGEIIGEGYHEQFGLEHAEVNAFRNSIMSSYDTSVYVNLEPCSISGKTPPCTDFLIGNSVSEVFISMLDPNPKVNGKGVEKLINSGIDVNVGILNEASLDLNKGYSKWITSSRPYVIAKVAQSKNGFIGMSNQERTIITSMDAQDHSHAVRSQVDAILVGRQTAFIDDPKLTVRNVLGHNPTRVVMDTNRRLSLDLKIFTDNKAKTLVLCSEDKFEKSSTSFCRYMPIREVNGMLCPFDTLRSLGGQNITSVLIEGGRSILETFFRNDLIDELLIYTSSENLAGATLVNPIELNDGDWEIVDERILGNDEVKVMKKKREICLPV